MYHAQIFLSLEDVCAQSKRERISSRFAPKSCNSLPKTNIQTARTIRMMATISTMSHAGADFFAAIGAIFSASAGDSSSADVDAPSSAQASHSASDVPASTESGSISAGSSCALSSALPAHSSEAVVSAVSSIKPASRVSSSAETSFP